jgi:hypothetical protein
MEGRPSIANLQGEEDEKEEEEDDDADDDLEDIGCACRTHLPEDRLLWGLF